MENILTIIAIVTGVLFGGIILAILILNKKWISLNTGK